ncbi:SgcJ/EcaC family oxidoreductase [Tellurirhabdus rosea]|uniref:SgcJ/EcaC family oxidoreductase n=1 Tax=Tellurirhabdus rosea TaxID=2674997 RepID=UPI002252AD62|nr:SgcJ/EcaC family oxidoreductase [Tellurirhabdus rosea]
MKRLMLLTGMFLLWAAKLKAQSPADSTAIAAILQEEATSWNSGDADTYSKHFAENGTFTNIRGMFFTGHRPFLDRHKEIFKGMFHKTVLQQELASFRFLSPDVALVETLTRVSGLSQNNLPPGMHVDAQGRLHTRLLQVFQKQAGNWKVITYHNVDIKPGVPVPALR